MEAALGRVHHLTRTPPRKPVQAIRLHFSLLLGTTCVARYCATHVVPEDLIGSRQAQGRLAPECTACGCSRCQAREDALSPAPLPPASRPLPDRHDAVVSHSSSSLTNLASLISGNTHLHSCSGTVRRDRATIEKGRAGGILTRRCRKSRAPD